MIDSRHVNTCIGSYILWFKFDKSHTFQLFEFVYRGSGTQIQMTENANWIAQKKLSCKGSKNVCFFYQQYQVHEKYQRKKQWSINRLPIREGGGVHLFIHSPVTPMKLVQLFRSTEFHLSWC